MSISLLRTLPVALIAALSLASTADAATAGCTTVASATKPFARWNDNNSYVFSPGGNFESTLPGWLTSGARLASGNESFHVGGAFDSRSLALGASGSATS